MSKLMNGAITKDQENIGTSVITAQWALLTIHSGVDTWTKNQLSALWNQILTNSIVYNKAGLHNCKPFVLLCSHIELIVYNSLYNCPIV